jgi:hypothetical protein
MLDRQSHWQNVYQTKGERDVSWFQETPTISLDLIRATGVGADAIRAGGTRLARPARAHRCGRSSRHERR